MRAMFAQAFEGGAAAGNCFDGKILLGQSRQERVSVGAFAFDQQYVNGFLHVPVTTVFVECVTRTHRLGASHACQGLLSRISKPVCKSSVGLDFIRLLRVYRNQRTIILPRLLIDPVGLLPGGCPGTEFGRRGQRNGEVNWPAAHLDYKIIKKPENSFQLVKCADE